MSRIYKGRRVFRNGPGVVMLFVGLTGLFAAGAVVTFRQNGWTWVSIGLAGATVILGLGSILENLVLRIELTEDALIATDLTGRKQYDIAATSDMNDVGLAIAADAQTHAELLNLVRKHFD